jgi:hypothetical protein
VLFLNVTLILKLMKRATTGKTCRRAPSRSTVRNPSVIFNSFRTVTGSVRFPPLSYVHGSAPRTAASIEDEKGGMNGTAFVSSKTWQCKTDCDGVHRVQFNLRLLLRTDRRFTTEPSTRASATAP